MPRKARYSKRLERSPLAKTIKKRYVERIGEKNIRLAMRTIDHLEITENNYSVFTIGKAYEISSKARKKGAKIPKYLPTTIGEEIKKFHNTEKKRIKEKSGEYEKKGLDHMKNVRIRVTPSEIHTLTNASIEHGHANVIDALKWMRGHEMIPRSAMSEAIKRFKHQRNDKKEVYRKRDQRIFAAQSRIREIAWKSKEKTVTKVLIESPFVKNVLGLLEKKGLVDKLGKQYSKKIFEQKRKIIKARERAKEQVDTIEKRTERKLELLELEKPPKEGTIKAVTYTYGAVFSAGKD